MSDDRTTDEFSTSDPIYCQNCGNEMPPVSEFCDECGVEVGSVVRDDTNTRLKASGIISGSLALVFLPIVLGPFSMICGYLLYDRGEHVWGKGIAAGGLVSTILGTVLALAITSLVQQCGLPA